MKIAPTLQALLEEPVKGVPMLAAYHGEVAVKELRALLAVARAAKNCTAEHNGYPYLKVTTQAEGQALDRALARLDALSRKGGGK